MKTSKLKTIEWLTADGEVMNPQLLMRRWYGPGRRLVLWLKCIACNDTWVDRIGEGQEIWRSFLRCPLCDRTKTVRMLGLRIEGPRGGTHGMWGMRP